MTLKRKLANRNEKSQGEFQKKDETKRVPQAQEIDNSREITIRKKNFSKLRPTRRDPQARVLSSPFCSKIIHLVIVFLNRKTVCFFLKHTAHNTLLYQK